MGFSQGWPPLERPSGWRSHIHDHSRADLCSRPLCLPACSPSDYWCPVWRPGRKVPAASVAKLHQAETRRPIEQRRFGVDASRQVLASKVCQCTQHDRDGWGPSHPSTSKRPYLGACRLRVCLSGPGSQPRRLSDELVQLALVQNEVLPVVELGCKQRTRGGACRADVRRAPAAARWEVAAWQEGTSRLHGGAAQGPHRYLCSKMLPHQRDGALGRAPTNHFHTAAACTPPQATH